MSIYLSWSPQLENSLMGRRRGQILGLHVSDQDQPIIKVGNVGTNLKKRQGGDIG
jgi:hypothetical protein